MRAGLLLAAALVFAGAGCGGSGGRTLSPRQVAHALEERGERVVVEELAVARAALSESLEEDAFGLAAAVRASATEPYT